MVRVRELREKAGLTRQVLATYAGLSTRALEYIEKGRDVKLSSLQAIADALGIPLIDLFPTQNGRKRKKAS